jgi:hypothetical protein
MSKSQLLEGPHNKLSAASLDCAPRPKEVPVMEQLLDQFVTRTLDRLELPCRYSVVYELTRIECLLNQPAYDDEFVADPLGSLWSISA